MSNPDLECRYGKFRIQAFIIKERPDVALAALAGVIVVRAEMVFLDGDIHYLGACKEFDPLPPHLEVPFYEAMIATGPDGTYYRSEWRRRDVPSFLLNSESIKPMFGLAPAVFVGIVEGVLQGIPSAIAAWQAITTAVRGGQEKLTPEQQAAVDADVDAAHQRLQDA